MLTVPSSCPSVLYDVPAPNFHKMYTWTSHDGKNDNQIDHMLVYRRWDSYILDLRPFKGADCDTDNYLVI